MNTVQAGALINVGDIVARQKRFKRTVSENVVQMVVGGSSLLGDRHDDVLDRDKFVSVTISRILARRFARQVLASWQGYGFDKRQDRAL